MRTGARGRAGYPLPLRVGAGADGSLTHSTRFVLVDGARCIRGYYIGSDDGFMPRLLHDIRQLEREKS